MTTESDLPELFKSNKVTPMKEGLKLLESNTVTPKERGKRSVERLKGIRRTDRKGQGLESSMDGNSQRDRTFT